MPPEALSRAARRPWQVVLPDVWRLPMIRLAAAWIVLIAVFSDDWLAMVRQWWNSSTYNHILLIPAIVAWLVWNRVPQLARLSPTTWLPGLGLFAGATLLWVLGAFAGLTIAREAGAVAVLIAVTLTLLGPRIGAGLCFPLAYMVLLVPFGDELVPPLQMTTAGLTIGLVHLSGISAVIDGVFINTPAGLFEVAEACSGVKFLIAMIAFGLLVCNVCFVGWRRRAAFMAFCLAVPIVANGIRAWATIYIAQSVGAARAVGIDHIIYGWVFFAVVIALVILASWRWFDRPADDPMIDAAVLEASPRLTGLVAMRIAPLAALLALGVLTMAGQGWARAADAMEATLPARLFLPDVPGWKRVDYAPRVWWEPHAGGAAHRLLGSYGNARGDTVDVFYALYSSQQEGGEAGGYGEGALPPGGVWSWRSPGPAAGPAKADRLLAHGNVGRLTETYYRTGDLLTGSNSRLKLANIGDRLLLRERPTALLILSAEDRAGHDAVRSVAAFRRSAGPLDQWMDRLAAIR